MDKITLASYMIKLKEKPANNYVPFDNYNNQTTLFGEQVETDFLVNLVDFFRENNEFTDTEKKKDLEIEHVYLKDRFCYGTAFYGSFGKFRKAKNVITKKTKNMDVDTAPEEPFYFLFYIPENSDRGIAIFERKGTIGTKDLFERFIEKELLKKSMKGFHLDYAGYLPKKIVLDYIKRGEILAFEFTDIPSHDKYEENRINHLFKKVRGTMKIKLQIDKYARPSAKQLLYKLINKELSLEKNDNDFIILGEIDTENSKVEVKVGKSKRFFYINGNSIRPFMDITNDITYEDGHPKFKDIHDIALEYAKSLLS